MKATLKNYHQPPRKVRLVADLIRGKSVPAARVALAFLDKKSAPAIVKLLDSAVANARSANESLDVDMLFVKTLTVDKGVTLKRVRPFKQGRAGRLHKIMSTVKMELGNRAGAPVKKVVETKPVEASVAKEAAAKPARKPRAKPARTTEAVQSGGKAATK
jgi:large subunit ribosomal protein L22